MLWANANSEDITNFNLFFLFVFDFFQVKVNLILIQSCWIDVQYVNEQ